jgi:hypothetical protein
MDDGQSSTAESNEDESSLVYLNSTSTSAPYNPTSTWKCIDILSELGFHTNSDVTLTTIHIFFCKIQCKNVLNVFTLRINHEARDRDD